MKKITKIEIDVVAKESRYIFTDEDGEKTTMEINGNLEIPMDTIELLEKTINAPAEEENNHDEIIEEYDYIISRLSRQRESIDDDFILCFNNDAQKTLLDAITNIDETIDVLYSKIEAMQERRREMY